MLKNAAAAEPVNRLFSLVLVLCAICLILAAFARADESLCYRVLAV